MLELALRSTLILAAAWALSRSMSRAAAATRHLVWHTALLLVLAAPLVAPIAPVIRLAPIAPSPGKEGVPNAAVAATAATTPLSQSASQMVRLLADQSDALGADVTSTVRTLASVGTAVCTVWFAFGWILAGHVVRRARRPPAAWQLEVNTLAQKLGIAREVRVATLDDGSSPVTTGVWRATILLPQSAAAWSDERRQAVLLHELAHVRRNDCRVQLVAQIACALYWFNPLVWMAAARLRAERERACDDEVLRCGARPSSYAAHLLDIARSLRPARRPTAALAMARPSELEGRLLAVLATDQARGSGRWSRWAVTTLLAATTVVAYGATTDVAPAVPGDAIAPIGSSKRFLAGLDTTLEEERAAAREARQQTVAIRDRWSDSADRELAVLALAFTSGRDVIPALLEALADRDAQVREKAAIGLALRRDPRVVEPLIAALSDPDGQVREKAAIALGTSGDPRAVDALTRALKDPDAQVREKAAAGLILHGLTP